MFFLQSRTKQINHKLNKHKASIASFRENIAKNQSVEAKQARKIWNGYSQPIRETIPIHIKNMAKLNAATKSFSGYFKSFFCPWTAPFKYRKEAANSIAIIEKSFHQVTLFASKACLFSHPKTASGNMKAAEPVTPSAKIADHMKKKA